MWNTHSRYPHKWVLAMSNHLRREADSFIFRRRIPDHLHHRFGQREIYRSLKTTVRKIAKVRAAQLFVATERLFRMVDEISDDLLPEEDIRAAVRYWLNSDIWTSRFGYRLDGLPPGILRERQDALPDLLLESWVEDYWVSPEKGAIEHAWCALVDAGYEGAARNQQTMSKAVSTLRKMLKERVDARVQEVFAPETITTAAAAPTQAPIDAPNMSRLSSFIGKWQSDLVKGYNGSKGLSEETTDQYLKTVELFVGLMGDLAVGKITHDVAAEFREKLLQLPKSHGKGRTGSLKKELARAKAKTSEPKLEMKTAKRHFSGMNSIWKWLKYRKHVSSTSQPFSGHSFPRTKSSKSARDAWSSEDLQKLFASREYRDAPKDSALHWMPLLALYSGLRLEEIGRLRPHHDFVTRDGVWCFDIKARDGWDPKTEAGTRIVPVHSWLLGHGFQDFVGSQKALGAEHLFPELVMRRNKLTADFSKRFSDLKQALGVGSKTTFHSFRHTFRTELESTDHKDSHINAVMGHEGGSGEGRVYTKGVTPKKLREVVEAFKSALDLSFLHAGVLPYAPSQISPRRVLKKVKLIPPIFDEKGKRVRTKGASPALK